MDGRTLSSSVPNEVSTAVSADLIRNEAATVETPTASYSRYLWFVLIARSYEVLPLPCPECGSEMRLVACVTEPEPVQRAQLHSGDPATPLLISLSHSPPIAKAFD